MRIGLTGPIGCGKSTVARWLAGLGAAVVDADELARAVVEPGEPALDQIVGEFGPTFLLPDGALDRPALGRLVFSDSEALRRLERIVHPAVRPRIVAAVADADAAGAPAVVVEAIKLVEAGYAAECDEVWLVTCDGAAQRERLAGRGLSTDEIDQRLAAQANLGQRLRPVATRVVDTSGSREAARSLVGEAYVAALEAHER